MAAISQNVSVCRLKGSKWSKTAGEWKVSFKCTTLTRITAMIGPNKTWESGQSQMAVPSPKEPNQLVPCPLVAVRSPFSQQPSRCHIFRLGPSMIPSRRRNGMERYERFKNLRTRPCSMTWLDASKTRTVWSTTCSPRSKAWKAVAWMAWRRPTNSTREIVNSCKNVQSISKFSLITLICNWAISRQRWTLCPKNSREPIKLGMTSGINYAHPKRTTCRCRTLSRVCNRRVSLSLHRCVISCRRR